MLFHVLFVSIVLLHVLFVSIVLLHVLFVSIVLLHVLFVSIVLFCVLFVCKCVLYYCHRVVIQLQLNISYINRHTPELHKHRHFFFLKKSNMLCTGKIFILHTRQQLQPFALCSFLVVTGKGKAIPLQAWTGPEGSRSFRLPDFQTIGT